MFYKFESNNGDRGLLVKASDNEVNWNYWGYIGEKFVFAIQVYTVY